MVQKSGTRSKTSSTKTNSKSKKKKRKKKGHRILKYTFITLFMILFLAAIAGTGIVFAIIKTAPPLDKNAILSLNEPSSIYDSNGKLMDYVATDEKRTVVSYNDMPDNLKNAFISIEDERFRQHNGIDIKRILGSVYADIVNKIHKQNNVQGASTITQQLVKNKVFYQSSLKNRLSFKRKIQEMYLATQLEKYLSKDQILEAYLNTIPLGGNTYGVEAASNLYFNKSAKDLSLAQCAFLAGINQAPSYYNPFSGTGKKTPSIYLDRTKVVLRKMYETKNITKDQYDGAINDLNSNKLALSQNTSNSNHLNYEWFSMPAMVQVKTDLKSKYQYTDSEIESMLMYGDLKIYTTMDKNLQDSAQKILNDDNNIGIKSTIKTIKAGNQTYNIPQPQASAVIMDYHTGEVKAIIGGRGDQPPLSYNRAAFNGVSQFYRPTGSSIKPLTVYSAAIDSKQATAATVIEDSPLPVEIGKLYPTADGPYNPTNYESEGFSGYVTLRDALARSINLVAIKLENQIGLKTGAQYGQKYGLTLDNVDKSSIAALSLGELHHGANTLNMAAAYGVFGNQGQYTAPRLYTKVVDRSGNVILQTKAVNSAVLSAQSAYIMYDLLKGPVSSGGTAPNAKYGDMPVAGKTGTSDSKKDFWFCGLTPYYSGAVWIGNDTPQSYNLYSSNAAGVWAKIMAEANKNLQVKDVQEPDGIERAVVCKVSGKIPSSLCSEDPRGNMTYSEMFLSGTVPKDTCDKHVSININSSNGKIATSTTPASLVQSKVFILRDYLPNVYLGDSPYVKPSEYDDTP